MLLIPAWTIYLHYIAACRPWGSMTVCPEGAIVIHLMILSLIVSGAYIINQIFDIESDRVNDKLYFLPQHIITLPTAWTCYAVLTLAGLGAAIFAQPHILPGSIALIGLGILYSAPGIRIKDRPVAGLVANAVGFGFLIPWIAASICPVKAVSTAALPYVFAIAAGYVLTTIPDRSGDSATGKRTVTVVLGQAGSLWLAAILAIMATAASVYLSNYEMAVTACIAVIGIGSLLATFGEKRLMVTIKLPILLLAVCATVHFPFYIIILLLTTVSTRVYYKKRFGMVYPKLG
jgi:geranylgeranylglycerol-phosphate geranylgeranyltransferase